MTTWLAIAVAATMGLRGGDARAASAIDRSGRFVIQWWTVDDGLPEAPLTGAAVAPDGAIVCASRSRIAWFDGVAFVPLAASLTDPLHARIGTFWNVGFDGDGRLWVQGSHAAAVLSGGRDAVGPEAWTIHESAADTFNSLAFTTAGRPTLVGPATVRVHAEAGFTALDEGPGPGVARRYGGVDPRSGDLWLWGAPGRPEAVWRVAAAALRDGRLAADDEGPGGEVISMGFGGRGPLALLADHVAVLGPAGWERLPPVLPEADYRASGKVAEAADGTIWVSSHNGLLACRDGRAEIVTGGLPAFPLYTSALVADDKDGIWAACGGGLLAVRRTRVRVEPLAECHAVFERADGGLLVGTPGAVVLLPAATGADEPAPPRPVATLPDAAVPTALLEDDAGRIWVGTQDSFLLRIEAGHVARVTNPDEYSRELRTIHALAADTRGRIWAATGNGLAVHDAATGAFRMLTPHDRFVQPAAIGLAPEDDGSVLVATLGRGVERVEADGATTPLLSAADLPGRRTIVFLRDSRGSLWVGGDQGLVRLRSSAAPLRLTTATGLVDDGIRQIEEDAAGRLWIATRGGRVQGLRLDDIDGLAAGRLEIVRGIVLGPLDGLGDGECIGRLTRRGGEATGPRDGPIVVPLDRGVARFDPTALDGGHDAGAPPTARRAPDGRGFLFSSPGLHWGDPPTHQTRLRGVDAGWSAPTTATSRDIPALPPGDHAFEVRTVRGETDRDFPVTRLEVHVPVPWWRRPAVFAAVAVALAATAAAVARELTRRRARRQIAALELQRTMDRERARIARDIHDSLGAGLTRMAMMSDLARTGAARGDLGERLDAIYRDARSLTRAVDEIVWAVNPGNDTVSQFVSYAIHDVHEFVRAGDLGLRLSVPDGPPDDRPLAAHVRHHVCLAVREALQNVLRHARATRVEFSIALSSNGLEVVVRDDGAGFVPGDASGPERDGLANMRQRMREAGGRLDVDSEPGRGTTVTFTVPLTLGGRPPAPDPDHAGVLHGG